MRKFILLLALTPLGAPLADALKNAHPSTERVDLVLLPKHEQHQWRDYFRRSTDWDSIDDRFIAAELEKLGKTETTPPVFARRFGFDIDQPAAWYARPEGRRIADIVLSFQTPSGGWSKRTDMGAQPRQPGQAFGIERNYIPTFDNAATTTQLQIMAFAYQATGEEKYRLSFLKGLYLILDAQFPNGGWPQTFPLNGSYHDYVTYNDEVISDILRLLHNVIEQHPPYDIVPELIRRRTEAAFHRGLDCILNTQLVVNGRKTAWAAQYDTFTLEPKKARAYEPVALASRESADLVNFLMSLPEQTPTIIEAIEAAVAWFNEVKIHGYRWELKINVSSAFTPEPGAAPLWARFYEIGSNRPIFGDRDGSIHYDVHKVSEERRIGYGWYTYTPQAMLERYEAWRKGLRASRSRGPNDEQ